MARVAVVFARNIDTDDSEIVQRITAHFTSPPQLVTYNGAHRFDIPTLARGFLADVENFNRRGSSFLLERISEFRLIVTRYRPLAASSYLPTPKSIAGKHAVINVLNRDQRCFEYALLSALHPPRDHPTRVSRYQKYLGTLCFDGIEFPVKVRDIDKFEKLNPTISVNVLSLDDGSNNSFCIERLSSETPKRVHHVTLLLLTDETGNAHYVWVKNFSRLLGQRTKGSMKRHVCNSCLNVFSSRPVLDRHIPNCLVHSPQQTVYPSANDPKQCKLRFRDYDKQHPLSFFLVCDFEAFLLPLDRDDIGNDDYDDDDDNDGVSDDDDDNDDDDSDSEMCIDDDNGDRVGAKEKKKKKKKKKIKTRLVDKHQISGFCCHRVTDIEQFQTPPTVYSGEDVMEHFYDHLMSESDEINRIMSVQLPMSRITSDEVLRHRSAKICENCRCNFTHDNPKVQHHDHTTGRYLFPACNNCNLLENGTSTLAYGHRKIAAFVT